jgi:hypothetical protein
MRPTPREVHELMEAAGYAWNADLDGWTRPGDERTLDAEVASTMRRDQLIAWLKAGETQTRQKRGRADRRDPVVLRRRRGVARGCSVWPPC